MSDGMSDHWHALVGECYSAAELAAVLGITVDALRHLPVLEVETDSGALLYPAFQVVSFGELNAVIVDAVISLAPHMREADIALWLSRPHLGLGDLSPRQWLDAGGNPDDVLVFATVTARRRAREN
ncbi:hypothetical protein [Demequina maris]|uniref:hypothetical protein n=1 Tax=Demequina maris TaxID=1638982 RepID=UPI000785106F|nr:hypothetical protein [Demequina maris]